MPEQGRDAPCGGVFGHVAQKRRVSGNGVRQLRPRPAAVVHARFHKQIVRRGAVKNMPPVAGRKRQTGRVPRQPLKTARACQQGHSGALAGDKRHGGRGKRFRTGHIVKIDAPIFRSHGHKVPALSNMRPSRAGGRPADHHERRAFSSNRRSNSLRRLLRRLAASFSAASSLSCRRRISSSAF